LLDAEMAAPGVVIADLDSDGRPDGGAIGSYAEYVK
jgi:hypothetical protein